MRGQETRELVRCTNALLAVTSKRAESVVTEAKLVVAEVEDISLVDLLGFDAVAAVFDAVGRAQIFDVVVAVVEDHRAVFARDVAIPDREVGLLASSTDDELVFIDRIAVVVKDQRERRATTRGKPLSATEATLLRLLGWGRCLLPTSGVGTRWGRRRTTGESSGRGGGRRRVAEAAAGRGWCGAILLADRRHALEGAVVHITATTAALEADVKAIDGLTTLTTWDAATDAIATAHHGRSLAHTAGRAVRVEVTAARVETHRLVDEVVHRAAELVRHLLEELPEVISAVEAAQRLAGLVGHRLP